jgi:UDP-glucose 4-epimerase
MRGMVFRFANVVGPQQTHGVAYDFLLKLTNTPNQLKIMGDGTQSKPYIHVSDVINAFMTIVDGEGKDMFGYEYYNVASTDFLTVNEIANLVCDQMGLKNVQFEYSGGSRGWKADVPFYRLNTTKMRAKGWSNKFGSREAVLDAVNSMITDIMAGKIKSK